MELRCKTQEKYFFSIFEGQRDSYKNTLKMQAILHQCLIIIMLFSKFKGNNLHAFD